MRLLYSNSHNQVGIHAPTQHLSPYPPTHLYSHQIIHNEQAAMSKLGAQLLPSLYDCPANLASPEYIPSYVQSNKRQSPCSTDSSQYHIHFTKEHLNRRTACTYVHKHTTLHQSSKSSHQLRIGASLSEPHTDEFRVDRFYIYIYVLVIPLSSVVSTNIYPVTIKQFPN